MYMLRGSRHISFDIAVVRFLAVEYKLVVRESINGEVNRKVFLKVRERAFSGLCYVKFLMGHN